MPAREFIDSNIWLYALVHASDAEAKQKHDRARILLSRVVRPVFNSQIAREVCSNLLKKAKLQEADATSMCSSPKGLPEKFLQQVVDEAQQV